MKMAPVQLSSCPFNERSLKPCNTPLLCSSSTGFFLLPPTSFFFFLVSLATAARPGLPVQHISFCSLLWPPRLPLTPTPSCRCCPAAAMSVSRGRRGRAQHNMYVPCRVRGSLAHPTPHPSLLPAGVCLVFFDPIECCCLAGRRTGPARSSPDPVRVAAPPRVAACLTIHRKHCAPTHPADGSVLPRLPSHTPSLHTIPSLLRIFSCFSPTIMHGGRGRAAAAVAHSAGVSVAIFVSPPFRRSFAPLRFPPWKCLSHPQLQSPIPAHQRLHAACIALPQAGMSGRTCPGCSPSATPCLGAPMHRRGQCDHL